MAENEVKGGPNPEKLIESIATAILGKTEEIFVEAFPEDGQTVIELEVPEEDVGRLIGRQGRTAKALRTVLNAVSERANKRYTLEIVE